MNIIGKTENENALSISTTAFPFYSSGLIYRKLGTYYIYFKIKKKKKSKQNSVNIQSFDLQNYFKF